MNFQKLQLKLGLVMRNIIQVSLLHHICVGYPRPSRLVSSALYLYSFPGGSFSSRPLCLSITLTAPKSNIFTSNLFPGLHAYTSTSYFVQVAVISPTYRDGLLPGLLFRPLPSIEYSWYSNYSDPCKQEISITVTALLKSFQQLPITLSTVLNLATVFSDLRSVCHPFTQALPAGLLAVL